MSITVYTRVSLYAREYHCIQISTVPGRIYICNLIGILVIWLMVYMLKDEPSVAESESRLVAKSDRSAVVTAGLQPASQSALAQEAMVSVGAHSHSVGQCLVESPAQDERLLACDPLMIDNKKDSTPLSALLVGGKIHDSMVCERELSPHESEVHPVSPSPSMTVPCTLSSVSDSLIKMNSSEFVVGQAKRPSSSTSTETNREQSTRDYVSTKEDTSNNHGLSTSNDVQPVGSPKFECVCGAVPSQKVWQQFSKVNKSTAFEVFKTVKS